MENDTSMSKTQITKAKEWIKEKSPKIKCELCKNKDWTVADDLTKVVILFTSDQVYPSIMLICNNCGNTKFINAVVAGIL